mgnify:CR=1 FL=1
MLQGVRNEHDGIQRLAFQVFFDGTRNGLIFHTAPCSGPRICRAPSVDNSI